MGGFPCTQCGICCRHVGVVLKTKDNFSDPVLEKALAEFPYGVDDQGACEKLVDGKCSVYDSRPAICNIDTMADLRGIDREEYYKLSALACNYMISAEGLPDSFLIKDYDC